MENLTFLMIMTRKGSFIPRVSFGLMGQVMKAVVTLVPMISRTDDWISLSVNLLIWPLWTGLMGMYFEGPRSGGVCSRCYTESTETLTGRCF